ncbi:YcaO-like family protein [Patescibacteria group bacterium]|nr:YcaO-like family protein [Patescibacteria group bacterium]
MINTVKFNEIKKCSRINLKDKNFFFWRCKCETPYAFCYSYGIDQNENKAKEKAVYECLERCFISFDETQQRQGMIIESYSGVKNKALNPDQIFPFSDNQYSQKEFRYTKLNSNDRIYWVKGKSLFKKKEILVPAAAVYCGYQRAKFEPLIGRANSNGCAIEHSISAAIINASLELIERDAVLIRWFNKLSSRKIKPDYLPDDLKLIIKTTEEDYHTDILINDLTTDFNIPVISVLLRSDTPPYFVFGAAANFSVKEAIIKALQECLLKRVALKNLKKYCSRYKNFDYIKDLYQHAEFYGKNKEYKAFRFLYESPYLSKIELKRYEAIDIDIQTNKEKIEYLKYRCKKIKKDLIFINLTPKSLESNSRIVRVIIPGLQPLNSEYNARYLGNERLHALPKQLGLRELHHKKISVNQYPHPL